MQLRGEVCQVPDAPLDGKRPELEPDCKARGPPPEEDLESNASTESGTNVLGSEVGEADLGSEPGAFAPPASPAETLVIFDWDDTLLPTSWLQRSARGGRALTPEQQGLLQGLARAAENTLRVAKEHGTVAVVTNAEEGWVQYSCGQYLPGLAPLLRDVRIISARSTYEPLGHSPDEWKCRAFQQLVADHYAQDHLRGGRRNVLSLGDSMHEHTALLRAAGGTPGCHAKSLKLSERPTVDHLTDEHEMLSGCLVEAIHHDGDLDLEIAEEAPPPCA